MTKKIFSVAFGILMLSAVSGTLSAQQVAVASGQLGFPGASTETQAIYNQGNGNYAIYSESTAYIAAVSNKGFPTPKPISRKEIDSRTGVVVIHLEPGQSVSVIYGAEQQKIKRAAVRGTKPVLVSPVQVLESRGEVRGEGLQKNIRSLE